MVVSNCDILVVGGGPAGAAAAWRAARTGAKVICLDKAEFPRDKPCGDGLTPRSVKLISDMGLGPQLERFHRVDRIKIASRSTWDVAWPQRPEMPDYGYVARRLELDEMLLRAAESVGAQVEEDVEVIGPLTTGSRISGVVANSSGVTREYFADVVIGADGAHSKLKRVITANEPPSRRQHWFGVDQGRGIVAVAIRAEMSSRRPVDGTLEAHILKYHDRYLPGYGWVFPVGGDRVNIGVGYLTSFRGWRDINARKLFEQFMDELPGEWMLPPTGELVSKKALQAWRLPMGFTTLPAWRPGVLFAGDAAGVAKPASGAGISRALESGMLAADCAVNAVGSGSADELSEYDRELKQRWGKTYRITRSVMRIESNPIGIALTLGLLDKSVVKKTAFRSIYGKSGHMDYRELSGRPLDVSISSHAG